MNRKAKGLIFFGLLWFLIALLPVSNLYPINAYMAEHWLYLPSIGLFLIAAGGLTYLYKVKGLKILFWVSVIGIAAFYCCLTIRQNKYWSNPITFYERSLEYAPGSIRMHNGLALAYYNAARPAKAIAAFKKAIEILPDTACFYNNLGSIYYVMGKQDEAIAMFTQAIEINPAYAEAYNNLAINYFKRKQYKLAIEYCDKAQELGFVNSQLLKDVKPYRAK